MPKTYRELFAELEIPGSEHTAREIAQQPAVWRQVADILQAARPELNTKVAPLIQRPDLRIILTGAGTSAYIGDTLAPALTEQLGCLVEAIPTTDIVANPRAVFAGDQPTLLVSFARSGQSPESVAAAELAEQCLTEVHHLIITCNADGYLATAQANQPRSTVLLLPPETNDKSFAMTSSFTSMLLTGWLALSGTSAAESAVMCDQLAKAGEALLNQRAAEIKDLAFPKPGRIVYLGSGALAGVAKEAGLKILELTAGQVAPWSDSSLGFRHGPKAILDPATLAVVFVSSDPYRRRYDLDIAREVQTALPAGRVLVLSAEPTDVAGVLNWTLPGVNSNGLNSDGVNSADLKSDVINSADLNSDGSTGANREVNDVPTALLGVLVAQALALFSAVSLGCTPDNPFPSGSVNRVVQGVTIYPLTS